MNCPFSVLCNSTWFTVKAITDPMIPINQGCYRPVEIICPEGTVLNCTYPASVVSGVTETSPRIIDMLLESPVAGGAGSRRGAKQRCGLLGHLQRPRSGQGARARLPPQDGDHGRSERRRFRRAPRQGRRVGDPRSGRQHRHAIDRADRAPDAAHCREMGAGAGLTAARAAGAAGSPATVSIASNTTRRR